MRYPSSQLSLKFLKGMHLHQLIMDQCLSRNVLSDMQFGCLIDFAKAFESMPHDHQALLNKLHQLNIPPVLFQWLSDYLSYRFQQVVLSSWLPVASGVPQGSILGPLLFLLYVSDISNIPFCTDSHLMCADDLLLFKLISC